MADVESQFDTYLAALPPERSTAIRRVWDVVRASMPPGFREEIGPKFLCFKADAEWYVALSNQKNYLSLYLMPIYVYPELKARLDADLGPVKHGKSCINFKAAEDLPLATIGTILAAHDADAYLAEVARVRETARQERRASRG